MLRTEILLQLKFFFYKSFHFYILYNNLFFHKKLKWKFLYKKNFDCSKFKIKATTTLGQFTYLNYHTKIDNISAYRLYVYDIFKSISKLYLEHIFINNRRFDGFQLEMLTCIYWYIIKTQYHFNILSKYSLLSINVNKNLFLIMSLAWFLYKNNKHPRRSFLCNIN